MPIWLPFPLTPDFKVERWVMLTCALVMAAGTASGGWRIIKTMGRKMVPPKTRPRPCRRGHRRCCYHTGIPLSTTHVISNSIMGIGANKRLSAVKWDIVSRIVRAWVLTLSITGLIGYFTCRLLHAFGI